MAFNRPAASDYQSVANYIYNREPVVEDERKWIYWKEDMITLRAGREHAWLDTGIERLLRFLRCQLIEVRYLKVMNLTNANQSKVVILLQGTTARLSTTSLLSNVAF